ncbi:hypothetical protein F9U64_01135 [Gracilibacillus oryzae]|uniref:Baseplate protein J-like barrel domain-containing protein n=1 Tax=Gracilibacillus oryzae TaxID=1672701 RepID=A0A7C8KT60_9BACI|nr:baseplate J/gp47 family protein [Gracilibacillus oryzae]KAB8139257.1 hypothetical protein F9U64_01135 [Gracilibacillus oryzae]
MLLDERGFKRKRYADIIASMEQRAREKFGEDVNLSERQFLGILIRVVAWFMSLFAQDLESAYNAGFVETSEGVALDRNAKRQGATRQQALFARGLLTITGEDNTVINSGFLVETARKIQFQTTETATIVNGSVNVPIRALERGVDGNVEANSITDIVTPRVGVNSVTNSEATSGGREKETDLAFKRRLDRTKKAENRLVFQLLNVEGVIDAFLYENVTMEELNGLPKKSIEPLVWGGNDQEVAQTILRYKAGGMQSFGETYVEVTDSKQQPQMIGFTRPEEVDVYVNATITGNVDLDAVRTKIIEYIGGRDEDGTEYDGLGINDNVIIFQVATHAGTVAGVEDAVIQVSIDGIDYNSNNIVINRKQRAVTDWEKVVVSQ